MLGITISCLGPTLPQLARNAHVDVQAMGWVFTGRGLGYILCALVAGKLLDHYSQKVDAETQLKINRAVLSLGVVTMTVSLCIIPFIPWLWLLTATHFIMGMGAGLLDLTANVLLVWLWNDRVNGPMQLLHFAFGLGAFLSPLIITLVDTIVTSMYGPGELVSVNPNTGFEIYNKQLHVRVSYITLGIINFSAAVLIIVLLRGGSTVKKEEPHVELEDVETSAAEAHDNKLLGEEQPHDEAELHGEPPVEPIVAEPNEEAELEALEQKRIQKKGIVISVLTGIALLFYVGAEIGFGGLIYSYVVEMRKIASEVEGNLLNSAFWLSFTIGRLLGAPLSIFLTPRAMLLIDAAGCMLALVVMTIFNTNMLVLWVFSIVLGLSLASQFPTTIALPATHMHLQVTGTMTSTMVFFAAIGEMVIPLLMTGVTASQLGPGSLFYLLVLVTLIATIMYIVLLFGFSREKPKHNTVNKL